MSPSTKLEICRLISSASSSVVRTSLAGKSSRSQEFDSQLSSPSLHWLPHNHFINSKPLSSDSKGLIQSSDVLAKSFRAVTYGHPGNSLKRSDFKSLRAVTYRNSPPKSLRAVTYEKQGGRGSLEGSNSCLEFSVSTLHPGIATH